MAVGIQECMDHMLVEHDFVWISLIGEDGMALCQAGIDEQFELAARLPTWVQSGHDIARAARMESGMGLLCLVPRQGSHALLMRDFSVERRGSFILLIATKRMPPRTATVLQDLCDRMVEFL